jgi:hypothetical protein
LFIFFFAAQVLAQLGTEGVLVLEIPHNIHITQILSQQMCFAFFALLIGASAARH